MNDRGGNVAGCFDVKEWADTTECEGCSYLVGERQIFIKDGGVEC